MLTSYQSPGLVLAKGAPPGDSVRHLQRDLRALGYLDRGIDGQFGDHTERAIKALQIDLLTPARGAAPVAITSFNLPAPVGGGLSVTQVTGVLDQYLAACIVALRDDPRVTWLPAAFDPVAENARVRDAISRLSGLPAPVPFMLAMFQQESGGCHYNEPGSGDVDSFITVGLDRNDPASPDRITSRGYGIGQATLFHHPPLPAEVRTVMQDPMGNVQAAFQEFGEKFDRFVAGPAARAVDRDAEHPGMPLRLCRYTPQDRRYLQDCVACARMVPTVDVHRGTPAYPGAHFGYQPDQYYPTADYPGVPDRAQLLCDWAYAARRYNGDGNDSFHYQARILRNLAALPSRRGS